MDSTDLTLGQSLKVWWSFIWRTWVLTLAIGLPLQLLMMFTFLKDFPPVNSHPDPATLAHAGKSLVLYVPITIALTLLIQAQAMRWMLRKARWSDFRLAVEPKQG
jgi:hypothetical protein